MDLSLPGVMAWRRIDIHRAAEHGDIAMIERYLGAGGDVQRKDPVYQAAPVHWASLGGKVKAVSLLLDRGAELEARTATHGTPLLWGCMGGHSGVIRHLLQRGADISAVTKGKGTALHHAAAYGKLEAVKMLLEKGASPEAEDNAGHKPGDKFDAQVSQGVRRTIALILGKSRGEVTPGKWLPGTPLTAPSHTVRSPVTIMPSSSGHPDAHNSNELPRRIRKTPRKRSNDHGGGRGNSGVDSKEASQKSIDHAGLPGAPGGCPGGGSTSSPPIPLLISNGRDSHAHDQDGVTLEGSDQSSGYEGNTSCASSRSVANAMGGRKELEVLRASPSIHMLDHAGLEQCPANRTDDASARRGSENDGVARANASVVQNPSNQNDAGVITATNSDAQHASWSPTPHRSDLVGFVRRSEAVATEFSTPEAPEAPEAQAELVDLRRQLAGLESAAWTAAERESQGRCAAREALKDAAARAEEFGRADRARSEKLGALIKALEKSLAERDGHVARLQEELEGRDARLRQAEQEVASLRARVSELEQDNRAQHSRVDGGVSTLAPVPASPHLGVREEGVLRAAPSPSSGVENTTPVQRRATLPIVTFGTSALRANGPGAFFGDDTTQPGDLGLYRKWDGNFRGDAGGGKTSTGSSTGALGNWGIEERSTVGGNSGNVGIVEWWRRGDWLDSLPPPPANPASAKKPDPAEDGERLGSLYSMIARR